MTTPLRFLHLEDNILDAELTLARLEDGGFLPKCVRVQTQRDYEAALSRETFDLILADYSLPSFDGFSALLIAREQCPETPFLFLSGALGEERAIETLKNGATDYVLKDNLDRLVPSVQRALREAQTERERRRAEASLQFLAEAGALLMSSLHIDTVFGDLVKLCVPRLAGICTAEIFDSSGNLQIIASTHEDPDQTAALLQYIRNHPCDLNAPNAGSAVLRDGRSVVVNSVQSGDISELLPDAAHRPAVENLQVRAFVLLPLQTRGRTLGLVTLVRTRNQTPFAPHEIELALNLAQRASLAADNALLLRESQDAVRARDEFLATVSHELRTPLNSILGWAHLVRVGGLSEEDAARAIETIERNAHVQSQLIDDLLDVSRVIAGKLSLSLETVNFARAARAALDALRPAAAAKSIFLEDMLDESAGEVVADANRLQQIVWNLLSNAIKFTPRGGNIRVELTRDDAFVTLSVCDSGDGIAAEFLPHVFDRFRQADSSSTRLHGGLGLGLAIVRHLTEVHGGMVEAKSAGLGCGSEFLVHLPRPTLAITPEHEKYFGTAAGEQAAKALDGMLILVVDDQSEARRLLKTVLEKAGAQVITASSAGLAYRLMQREPHLIISDIGMPGEDGYGFIRRVRESTEPWSKTPALALTTFARTEDRTRALAGGFQYFAVKPIDPFDLVRLAGELAKK
ncbi:MAG TPA: response regulator [Abditibacteriaceae bacterium]|jgi:signal transduction histidine kinase/CheY-like chemotaxis protein